VSQKYDKGPKFCLLIKRYLQWPHPGTHSMTACTHIHQSDVVTKRLRTH